MPNILGINLSSDTQELARNKLVSWLDTSGTKFVVTPNPEIILASHQDEEFFYILNQADLSLPDGIGLKIAAYIFGQRLSRITGSDTTNFLLQTANNKSLKVLILNWCHGLSSADDISSAVKKQFPNIDLLVLDIEKTSKLQADTIKKINDFTPHILFCTLGFPWQEKLLYHHLKLLSTVKIAIGVGGSFDFITTKTKRAPHCFRYLGLEWFWRLIIQPHRYRRIYQATLVFLLKVLRARYINRFRYRPNVVCFLFKKTAAGVQVLLVEREDNAGHWQLPQGGTDGESLTVAGKRELHEELGVTSLTVKAVFNNVHRYKFASNSAKRSYNIDSNQDAKKFKYDYLGQNQGLLIAEFTGLDEEIRINFWDHTAWKWVPLEKLLSVIHPVRRNSAIKFIDKFSSLNNK